jgi:uncharacterized protein YjbJ (UPF0337 family)
MLGVVLQRIQRSLIVQLMTRNYIGTVALKIFRSDSLSQARCTIKTAKGNEAMNKDQVEGRIDQVKGAIKETTGKAVGNDKLEAEGKANKVVGKVQANVGDAKEKVKDAVDKFIDKA